MGMDAEAVLPVQKFSTKRIAVISAVVVAVLLTFSAWKHNSNLESEAKKPQKVRVSKTAKPIKRATVASLMSMRAEQRWTLQLRYMPEKFDLSLIDPMFPADASYSSLTNMTVKDFMALTIDDVKRMTPSDLKNRPLIAMMTMSGSYYDTKKLLENFQLIFND